MTKQQEKVAEQLLTNIEKAEKKEKVEAVEAYRHFMEACHISWSMNTKK